MASDVKLSVLLPVYNQANYISQCLDGILRQTYQDWELLICDDGSTDHSLEIIESFRDPRIKIFTNDKNMGKIFSVNKIFNEAKGEFITVHDADDFSDPTRFELQTNRLEREVDVVACGTNFNQLTTGGKRIRQIILPEIIVGGSNPETFSQSFIHGPTAVFRRDAIKETIVYRHFFADYNEDVDLFFRLLEKGSICNLQEFLYNYRICPGSLSKNLSPRKKVYFPLIVELSKQRKIRGSDWLIDGKEGMANKFLDEKAKSEYPSLIHFREYCIGHCLYYRLHFVSLQAAWFNLFEFPKNFKSYRLFFYTLRRIILRSWIS